MSDAAILGLVPTQFLTNAAAIYYTMTGMPNDKAVVNVIVFCNTTANTTWVGRYPDDGLCVIKPGGTLQGLASANSSVTFTMSGREYH